MSGVHDRLTLPMMLRAGRKSRFIHRAISIEVSRLYGRAIELEHVAAGARTEFVADLAIEQAQRLAARRGDLLRQSGRGKP